jgi:phosphoglycolate phosphatase-like HAD superfamily hydrolase
MLNFSPKNDYLIGIDSDGCVFDTMELKHKECFIPNTINYWNLQGVSKYAREAAEFVNLYSKSRGINRFPALVEALDWLRRRAEVKARGLEIPNPTDLIDWIGKETKLGNPALIRAVEETGNETLKQTLAWSEAVNQAVTDMVRGVPPFPFVRECLDKMNEKADVLVVSATPNEALNREWEEHGLDDQVEAICGQEIGTKAQMLVKAREYAADHTLMIGDAPGDYNAAVANDALYFPINPGDEETSWERLFSEGIDLFFAGSFAGDYQKQLLDEFEKHLPENPPWSVD